MRSAWLQIIYCSCINVKPRFRPSCNRSAVKMADRLQSTTVFIKKQTGQIIDLLATDQSRYFAVSLTYPCLNNAFYLGILYLWMSMQKVFYFSWINVLPSSNN